MESKEKKAVVNILELVKRIEDRAIDPQTLDKKTLIVCASRLRWRGHSNIEISDLLNVDERTVLRYLKKSKFDAVIDFNADFQKEIATEIINSARQHSQRVLRLSHSPNLTAYEEARMLTMSYQIMASGAMILEKLGYLYREIGINQVTMGGSSIDEKKLREALGKNLIYANKLTQEQKRKIVYYFFSQMQIDPKKEEEIRRGVDTLVFNFAEESEMYNAMIGKHINDNVAPEDVKVM